MFNCDLNEQKAQTQSDTEHIPGLCLEKLFGPNAGHACEEEQNE